MKLTTLQSDFKIPVPLQKRLLDAGWGGDMRFDAVDGSYTLGGWLANKIDGPGDALELLRDCLKSGMPFYHTHTEKNNPFVFDLLNIATAKGLLKPLWDMLFKEGLDINQRLDDEDTLLILCCDYLNGSIQTDKLFQYLWAKNPDLTLSNDLGQTIPLLVANSSPLDMPWLIEQGVSCSGVLWDKKTQQTMGNILTQLLDGLYNASMTTSLGTVDVQTTESLLQLCIDKGADVHGVYVGNSVLHQAAFWHPQAIPFLIDKGVDINLTDDFGKTVLDILQEKIIPEESEEEKKIMQKSIDKIILKMRESLDGTVPHSLKKSGPSSRI